MIGETRTPPWPNARLSITVQKGGPGAGQRAITEYQVLHADKKQSLVRVRLLTGRKHQIRIHLAHIGHPIVGDKLYGGDEEIYLSFVQYRLSEAQQNGLLLENQALHAQRVQFAWRGTDRMFEAKPEQPFLAFAGISKWPPPGSDQMSHG